MVEDCALQARTSVAGDEPATRIVDEARDSLLKIRRLRQRRSGEASLGSLQRQRIYSVLAFPLTRAHSGAAAMAGRASATLSAEVGRKIFDDPGLVILGDRCAEGFHHLRHLG